MGKEMASIKWNALVFVVYFSMQLVSMREIGSCNDETELNFTSHYVDNAVCPPLETQWRLRQQCRSLAQRKDCCIRTEDGCIDMQQVITRLRMSEMSSGNERYYLQFVLRKQRNSSCWGYIIDQMEPSTAEDRCRYLGFDKEQIDAQVFVKAATKYVFNISMLPSGNTLKIPLTWEIPDECELLGISQFSSAIENGSSYRGCTQVNLNNFEYMVNLTKFICKDAQNDTGQVVDIINSRVTNCRLQILSDGVKPTQILEAALGVVGGLLLVSILIIVIRLKKKPLVTYRRMQDQDTAPTVFILYPEGCKVLLLLIRAISEYLDRNGLHVVRYGITETGGIYQSIERNLTKANNILVMCTTKLETDLECHRSFTYGIHWLKEKVYQRQVEFNLFVGLVFGDANIDYIPVGLMDVTNDRYELPRDMRKWTKKLLSLYGREADATALELNEVELGVLDNIAEEVSATQHEHCRQSECLKGINNSQSERQSNLREVNRRNQIRQLLAAMNSVNSLSLPHTSLSVLNMYSYRDINTQSIPESLQFELEAL